MPNTPPSSTDEAAVEAAEDIHSCIEVEHDLVIVNHGHFARIITDAYAMADQGGLNDVTDPVALRRWLRSSLGRAKYLDALLTAEREVRKKLVEALQRTSTTSPALAAVLSSAIAAAEKLGEA